MSGSYQCHHHNSQCVAAAEARRGRSSVAAADIAAALISIPLLVVLALLLRENVKIVTRQGPTASPQDKPEQPTNGDPEGDPRWRVLGLGLALLTLSLFMCCYVTHRLGLCCRSKRMVGGRRRRTNTRRDRNRNAVGENADQSTNPGSPQNNGAPFAVCVEPRGCGSTSSQLTLVSSSADRPPPPSYDSVIKADAPPPSYSTVAWMMPQSLCKEKTEQSPDNIPATPPINMTCQPP